MKDASDPDPKEAVFAVVFLLIVLSLLYGLVYGLYTTLKANNARAFDQCLVQYSDPKYCNLLIRGPR